jgi:hypothetical protein
MNKKYRHLPNIKMVPEYFSSKVRQSIKPPQVSHLHSQIAPPALRPAHSIANRRHSLSFHRAVT